MKQFTQFSRWDGSFYKVIWVKLQAEVKSIDKGDSKVKPIYKMYLIGVVYLKQEGNINHGGLRKC